VGVCKYYIGDLSLSTADCNSCRLGIDRQRTHSLHRNDMAYCHFIMPRVGCKLYFPNDRCSAISYIRLLLDDSMLKAHQHRIGLEASNSCDCGLGIDDIEHFLLQCTLYDDLRDVLKHNVTNVWERCESRGSLKLSVQLLLFPFATDQLTYVECCDILSATFNFIRNSQRQL